MKPTDLIITNASIVTPGAVIEDGSVIIENGKIKNILPSAESYSHSNHSVIEANGSFLLPGIIDIHTDAIDLEICPRSSADFPINIAFRELEKRMCGCGITTVFHSIHLGSRMYESSLRSKYSRMTIFENVYEACQANSLINNKIHLRYEITGIDQYEQCFELVERGYVSMFSFMDHSPVLTGDDLKNFAIRRGFTFHQAQVEMEARMQMPKISKDKINVLAQVLQSENIPIASHDDYMVQQVEENYSLGINLCEFPLNIETAKKAIELNMYVIGGAANVLRGGSNVGNLGVQNAISERAINVLCSDYYPPALLHSVFLLYKKNIITLPEAVNLTSLNPAKAANIASSKGSIEIGKDADLLLVDYSNHFPTLVNTIVGGNISGKFNLKSSELYEFNNA